MACKQWIALSTALFLGVLVGCNQSGSPGGKADGAGPATASIGGAIAPSFNTPAQAVKEWLEAVRSGDDARATAMLTKVAREKAGNVQPPASDTARFQVGAVEMIGEDGARVSSVWTDLDETGKAQSDEMLWVLRKEAEGWRIAGVAATVFEGEPPLLLNFEEPEEMARKQKWAREEVQRRYEAGDRQAQTGDPSDPAIRR